MWAAVSINTGTGRLAQLHTTTSRGSLVGHTEGSASREGGTIALKVLRAVGLCRPQSLHQRHCSHITLPPLLGTYRKWTLGEGVTFQFL